MQVESNATQENLYEIPNCTICLNEMTEDLASLSCGHVFHLHCISHNFTYRGNCPNCQKRSHEKVFCQIIQQIRVVVFPLHKNTEAARLMRQVLGNLSMQEKQQVQVLFKQVQSLTEKNQKLENRCTQAEKQSKKSNTELNDAKTCLNRTKSEYEAIKKDCAELRKVVDHFHIQINKLNDQNFDLRQQILAYKEKQAELEQLKKFKRLMYENAQYLIDYKNELTKKNASPVDMANQFFDMVLIKNLENQKLRNRLEGHPEQLMAKDEEISKLEQNLQRVKKQVKENKEKLGAQKKKYDELKQRYKKLIEKYKAKCQELSDDDNYQDSMLSRPSFPLVSTNNITRQNSGGSGLMSLSVNENSQSNILLQQKKINKRSSENMLKMMIEEEPQMNITKSQPQNKPPVQKSLNNFFLPNGQKPLMSFGGVKPKVKVEETKKPNPFKNLFN